MVGGREGGKEREKREELYFQSIKKHEKSWVGDEGAKREEKGHVRVGGKELLGGK